MGQNFLFFLREKKIEEVCLYVCMSSYLWNSLFVIQTTISAHWFDFPVQLCLVTWLKNFQKRNKEGIGGGFWWGRERLQITENEGNCWYTSESCCNLYKLGKLAGMNLMRSTDKKWRVLYQERNNPVQQCMLVTTKLESVLEGNNLEVLVDKKLNTG